MKTQDEKNKILNLRKEGFVYKAISNKTNKPRDTVRVICLKRHILRKRKRGPKSKITAGHKLMLKRKIASLKDNCKKVNCRKIDFRIPYFSITLCYDTIHSRTRHEILGGPKGNVVFSHVDICFNLSAHCKIQGRLKYIFKVKVSYLLSND